MKNIRIFIWKLSVFFVVKFSIYLNRCVFVMYVFLCFGCPAMFLYLLKEKKINQPAYNKTYNKTCVTSKDSEQPVHPPSMARVLVYPSLDSPKSLEDTRNQRRLWSDCVDAQADLSLHWSHKFNYRFCQALVQIIFSFTIDLLRLGISFTIITANCFQLGKSNILIFQFLNHWNKYKYYSTDNKDTSLSLQLRENTQNFFAFCFKGRQLPAD